MCPRNHKNCSIVPVGIVPLLPPSNPPSPTSVSPPPHTGPTDSPPSHDGVCTDYLSHPTPPPSSSDDEHSDSAPRLVFRSSLDRNDPADPASPSTPTRRSMSPIRTRKVAQHTSPSQQLARDVPSASDRLAALCAPTPALAGSPAFQIGPSPHRSASEGESDSDSDRCHHRQQYTPSNRTPLKRDEQYSDEDADDDDDEVEVVPPPFAPPPCPYIQPGTGLLSEPGACFSLAQPAPSVQPALAPLPKMPLFPFMPLLPTPREHSSPSAGPWSSD